MGDAEVTPSTGGAVMEYRLCSAEFWCAVLEYRRCNTGVQRCSAGVQRWCSAGVPAVQRWSTDGSVL